MEKILLAVDANRQNIQAVDFACYVARLTGSRLTGAFLEMGDKAGQASISGQTDFCREGAVEGGGFSDANPVAASLRRFREACVCREVLGRVHKNTGVTVKEILLESRFSDLLIIDPEGSYENEEPAPSGHFLKEMFERAECPVIASPFGFSPIEHIVFSYDGSAPSVFAIKQFTYLFPQCRKTHVTVVTVRKSQTEEEDFCAGMREWCAVHYEHVEYEVLTGDVPDQLFKYLLDKKGILAVLGAMGRGFIFNLFGQATTRLYLRTLNIPLFIAHC